MEGVANQFEIPGLRDSGTLQYPILSACEISFEQQVQSPSKDAKCMS